MDTLQCAVVLAKLERFDWEVEQRIAIGTRYNAMLDEKGIKRVTQRDERMSVFAQFTVLLENREAVQAKLSEAGIPTAVHYPIPLNEQPAYKHLCCSDCTPLSCAAAKRVMSLPMGPDLDQETQNSIIAYLVG
jgi:UDP-2-acetamido-2-deoxy-ribo-hexuluronate aminotransferase